MCLNSNKWVFRLFYLGILAEKRTMGKPTIVKQYYPFKAIVINFSEINNIVHTVTEPPTEEEVFQIIEKLLTIETID
jgi:hypothetical protein